MIEFMGFGKVPRLNRDITLTEKIDGTQGAIGIVDLSNPRSMLNDDPADIAKCLHFRTENGIGDPWAVYAQSRNRIITPDADNHGFARWVWDNAQALVATLGEGVHFGEWWGSGINRNYGLAKGERRFSLFNTKRWAPGLIQGTKVLGEGLEVVPVLYHGMYTPQAADKALAWLAMNGSYASPGFMNPEGIVMYHTAAHVMFKVTLENDSVPKAAVKRSLALAA